MKIMDYLNMKKDMRHFIRIFFILFSLLLGSTNEAWADLTPSDIIIDGGTLDEGETPYKYNILHGSVTVKSVEAATRKVTITVTPDAGYFVNKSDIVVEKLFDPSNALSRTREPAIADALVVSGLWSSDVAADFTFVVPADYAGALVKVTFLMKTVATAVVTANTPTYNGTAQALVTLDNVIGAGFDSGTVLDAETSLAGYYTKSGDVYTPCSADGEADGETKYYKPVVTYSVEGPYDSGTVLEAGISLNGYYTKTDDGYVACISSGTADGTTTYYQRLESFSTDGSSAVIPEKTDAGTYVVYYIVTPDATHSQGSGSVLVTIYPAHLTEVTLEQSVKNYTGNPITFVINSVKAGSVTASTADTDYEVDEVNGDALTQTEIGTYTLKVNGKGNFTGTLTTTFGILDADITIIDNSTDASTITQLNGYYVLASDISALILANLYNDSEPFTGTLDGNSHKITGLSHALFNTINGGTVKNVMLDAVNISGGTNVGAIANEVTGTSGNMASIYNCGVLSGSVSGSGYVGSIVGQLGQLGDSDNGDNCYARVINCFSYATVSGGSDVGGIVGNNVFASTAAKIRTMVMNCMFYGDITSGDNVSPIYGGEIIDNLQGGLNTFNYYAYSQLTTAAITKYNCALAVEEKYLNRFEYYRLLLNSNKKLAAFYATGSHDNADKKMLKWVLETADRTKGNPYPYPILKTQGYYPSIINPDFENAPDSTVIGRNKGGQLGKTLSVTISNTKTDGGQSWPSGAGITTTSLSLTRTDKDFDRFNFNYDKVQLPYYNDVGTGNYTGNRVVTGWKITAIDAVEGDPYTAANYDYTNKTYADNPDYFEYPNYNFADRRSSNKDLYSVSGRVFSQGAYFDVPYGVTSITIEPYWGQAAYIADQYYDLVYYKSKADYDSSQKVTQTKVQVGSGAKYKSQSQTIYTSISNTLLSSLTGTTVYDNAIVLVGNLHLNNVPSGKDGTTPFTMMSVDEDNDHEPDYSLIYHHKSRTAITPIRFDFLNIPGTAQAQKPNGASLICNFTIFKTKGWFEVTNTSSFYSSQLEYENQADVTKSDAPLILLGGVIDQFVSTQSSAVDGHTIYIHVGGNVWINSFGLGTHSDGSSSTPHVPVSVTGGEFPGFYLTGTYKADALVREDNAECYISGGYFHEAAGASLEQINGSVRWQIYNADIDNFFGGGINDAKPIKGDITVDIYNSNVTLFCGGPKFGNMQTDKKVTTNAEGCTFGKYFGAGYGGTSYSKKKYHDLNGNQDWATLQGYYTTDRGKYFNGISTGSSQISGKDYGKKGPGVATDFDYEFFVWSSGETGARLYVNFASFSLAKCNDVFSTLKKCTVEENFYGGGNLGKVVGTATSVLEDCTVKGSVYGAGYSASLPTVEVRDEGFTRNPNYNSQSGMFEPGVFSGTTPFTWQNATASGKTLTNGQSGSDLTNHILYTNTELTGLGEVAQTNLAIKGTTTVGESVYGGGEESGVDGNTTVLVTGGTIGTTGLGEATWGNVYGGGKGKAGDKVAGYVKGNTTVNISQAESKSTTILHNVYGGGAYGSVGDFTYDATSGMPTAATENTGACTVNITGGTIGTTGKNNGMVFGSSRGDVATHGTDGVDPNDRMAWVYSTHVTIGDTSAETSPSIKGSVYGSGENGHTLQNTTVDVLSGTIGIISGEKVTDDAGIEYEGATYPYRGNVYGGGCGTDTYWIDANENSEVDEGEKHYNPLAGIVRGTATVNISGGQVVHNVYGAGAMGSVGNDADPNSGKTTVNISGGRIGYTGERDGNVFGAARGEYGISTATSNLANVRETEVNISYGTTPSADKTDKTEKLIAGSVFGGGESGTVKESVAVNMTGGLILKDIYGGGALADTQTSNWDTTKNSGAGGWAKADKKSALHTTTVRATGGRVVEEIFGGGLGEAGTEQNPTGKPAYVWGDVLVELNKDVADDANGCVVGQVFGCNNINGTPKGDVKVHICKTQNVAATRITNPTEGEKTAKVTNRYDVNAVYGGGNQSAYEPADPNSNKTEVIIDGCDRTSIQQVYGGGNAACTPATNVTVNGTFEILELFGGGNGLDNILINGVEMPNPGANVGYKNYSEYYQENGVWKVRDDADYDTKEERMAATDLVYGTGKASVNIYGGTVHRVFGGSNTKGNVRQTAVTLLDEEGECDFCVDEAYGGGKSAPMDAEAQLHMACIPGLKAAYGGAQDADIQDDVKLNITNGTFDRVFGGNNENGKIHGTITVNIEETGCKPLIIGELYGGGNLAPYEAPEGKNGPTLNVRSFTSIGDVFGGGYGENAVVKGDIYVNINVAEGKFIDYVGEEAKYDEDDYPYDANGYKGKTLSIDGHQVILPNHAKGKIGAINYVYGGGNEAKVIGNTNVNVGTTAKEKFASLTDNQETTDVDESEKAVVGADIRGNVYGGGNNAEVTGNTNVTIGKKEE